MNVNMCVNIIVIMCVNMYKNDCKHMCSWQHSQPICQNSWKLLPKTLEGQHTTLLQRDTVYYMWYATAWDIDTIGEWPTLDMVT